MKWKEPGEREYYAKYEEVPLANGQDWFVCYRLPENVYVICEPQHFQEVNAFLIIGSERALLWDTGMGIGDIRPVIDELYQGELLVANSHFHFDHVGSNWRFEKVFAPEDPFVRQVAENGIPGEALKDQLEEYAFLYDYPKWFRPEEYRIRPYRTEDIAEGRLFDLGDRSLVYLRTPGHSGDCAMLYEREHHILFTGDMFYLGALYVQMDSPEFGKSDLRQYIASVERLTKDFPEVRMLYASHNDPVIPGARLTELRDALYAVRDHTAEGALLQESLHAHLADAKKLVQYPFDGFSIVVRE